MGFIGLVSSLAKFQKYIELWAQGTEAKGKFASAQVGEEFTTTIPDEAHVRGRLDRKRFELVSVDFDTNEARWRRLPDVGKGKSSGGGAP